MTHKKGRRTIGRSFLISAGEASGDTHGAGFITELRKRYPGCSVFGIGGDKMRGSGMEILCSIDKLAVLGFTEVVRHIPFIRKTFNALLSEAKKRKPDAVVLIDYPDFNIRLAQKIRRHFKETVKIFYYVSPQVWAWRKKRVRVITRCVDAMAVVFPFEEESYRRTGMTVRFVGHPLLDIVKPSSTREEFFTGYSLSPDKPVIGLLPGSRRQEIVRHLPEMRGAVRLLRRDFGPVQAVVGRAPNIPQQVYDSGMKGGGQEVVYTDEVYNVMHYSTVVIVSSGTATLETAIAGTPMVIVYKMAPFTHFIARRMVSLPSIGLVNIVHGRKTVPELIQREVNPGTICTTVREMLSDKAVYAGIQKSLSETRRLLGEPGAAGRAVDLLSELLEG